jgi:hypothetical protein
LDELPADDGVGLEIAEVDADVDDVEIAEVDADADDVEAAKDKVSHIGSITSICIVSQEKL